MPISKLVDQNTMVHLHNGILCSRKKEGNPNTLLVGMQTGAATVENSMEFPQNTKNITAF